MTMEESLDNVNTPDRRTPRVHILRQLRRVFFVGAVLATMYTAWTPLGLIPLDWATRITQAFNNPGAEGEFGAITFPTPTPRPRPQIGIVSGHWGNDSGAVCADGLTEAEINLEVATLVKQRLSAEGFDVDLLREFDEKLIEYRGLALVSIHADSCEFINADASGYKVAAALGTVRPEKASRLVACLRGRYEQVTGLSYHSGSITDDMTSYHAFDEIHFETTAAIIEIGFMNLDRQILTQNPDLIAQGVADGVLCFIRNESVTISPDQ
ncbi:MAG: hypothetical protein DWQ07_16370 [Chloroflexi bacterium]|nr:MAG: hypothetical protein DWQ07_16370 [Chloroflexota bacterium]MBL1195328.1 hypothetical protein [Chloroflexota bacterium]NOH12612.1 hypothetical protein [Chloroflexota bacterium]